MDHDSEEQPDGDAPEPQEVASLAGQLLIASARMQDPNFSSTVIYMLRHSAEGALGVVLNRVTEVSLRKLGREILGEEILREGQLYVGGPCEGPLMAVWRGGLLDGGEEVGVGSEEEVLRFAGDRGTLMRLLKGVEGDVRFFAGYSGWTAGQLEKEMAEGSWMAIPARQELVLGVADRLWDRTVIEAVVGYPVKAEILPKDPSSN